MGYIKELDKENLIVQVLPELEESYLKAIKLEFMKSGNAENAKRVFLNFSAVQKINSVSLSVLFSLNLFFKNLGIEVIAVNLNENVSSVLKSVGLEQILEKEFKGEFVSAFIKSESNESLIKNLNMELEYQKELYKRVTLELEEKLLQCTSELKSKNEQLQFLDKNNLIGELAAGVAHEFNNIIGGILGYAQLAQAKKTEELIDKALNNIVTLSKRSESITSGLLNFSRKRPVKLSKIHFSEVVQGILDFTQKQLENANITIHKDFKPVEQFYADESLLSQVILNLVINASHAMEHGGDIYLSIYKENSFIIFKIRDTGIGIKKANLDRIFSPFFTTKGALGGGNKSGTGLGLSVSKNIVEMHEGFLEVESEENKGATFTIKLPEKIASNEYKEKIDRYRYGNVGEEKKGAKILVVDDEEMIRTLIAAALADSGHDIIEGANGEDGVKLFVSHNPDLVFLDILMPRMNGMDAYLEIKLRNPKAKIIFITGEAGDYLERILANMSKNENVYLLRKPFEIDELLNVVKVALSVKTE